MISHRITQNWDGKSLLGGFAARSKKPPAATAEWTPVPPPLAGPQLVFDAGMVLPLPPLLKEGLERVRRKERLGRMLEGASIFFAAVLVLILTQIFFDHVFKLPWLARAAFLAGDIVGLRLLWKQVHGRFFGPGLSDEEAALRIEKHYPFLDGSLIGAVELAGGKPGATQGSPGLLQALVDEAAGKMERLNPDESVSFSQAWQWTGGVLVALGLALVVTVQAWPTSGIFLQRLLLLNPAVPTATKVNQVTGDMVLPEGGAVTLSARARGSIPSSGHVLLVYADGRREDIPAKALTADPGLFSVTIAGIQAPFRYLFFLHDGEGQEYEVKVEPAPVVQSLKWDRPDLKGKPEGEASFLGKIYWEEGENLKLAATASAPLKSAVLNLEIKGKTVPYSMKIEGFGRRIAKVEIPDTEKEASGFSIELLGENNAKSTNNVRYSLERILSSRGLSEDDLKKTPNASAPGLVGMRTKDREALFNLQSEPVPDEYTAMVRQYLKNIAGESTPP